ncbi:MAG: 50S ribosomal protein L5 [Candidatus Bathyarchaeota archaeon]|nr:50S ribosomal protein L5 [Candidatus Bathyarchaeota archaeon]
MTNEERFHKQWQETPMLKPRIQKVTVNISVGQSGAPLEKATKILEELTGQRPVKRKAKRTLRDFGIRQGEPVACLVTLRKEKASRFLARALQAIDNRIPKKSFDRSGNFSFGIREHIEIPDTRYTPELGIFGMNVSVDLGRAGYRVSRRRRTKSDVGSKHLLTPDEAIEFMRDATEVEIG